MPDPNASKAPADEHESVSGLAQPSRDHELWDGAAPAETEKSQFCDDAPGESSGMAENVPGLESFYLNSDDADDRGGPVAGRVLDAAPWAWVLRLTVAYEDGSQAVYTGWLASPRVIVTTGRCLFDHSRGAAREVAVEATPSGAPSGRRWIKSSDFKLVKGWVRSANPECDYGAILLPGAGLPGIGHFGLAWLPGQRPTGELFNLSGYPAERSDAMQWHETFRIVEASERFLHRVGGFHNAAAGSPVWIYMIRNGRAQRYVSGMVGSNADGGDALRIHRDLYDNILDWIDKAEAPSAPPSAANAANANATSQTAASAVTAASNSGNQSIVVHGG